MSLTGRSGHPYRRNVAEEQIRWHRVTEEERLAIRLAAARVLGPRPWVKAAWLYGSAARGVRPSRDIDIGLLADPLPLWRAVGEIAPELGREIGLGELEFDVRVVNGASPVFLNNLLREGALLYEADRAARLAFQASAMSQWLDFRPAWERVRDQVLRRWAGG